MSPTRLALATLLAALAVAPPAALSDNDRGYFSSDDDSSFTVERPRTRSQRITIASLFGGAVVAAGVGVLFNLDSNSKSDEVSVVGHHTGTIYTRELDDTRQSALSSRRAAIVGYSVAGALLVAGVVAFIVTDPGSETVHVESHAAQSFVAPTRGGAMVGRSWSF